jgi:N-acetylglutamate synthase-like GNAT family acetyltransferase
MMGVVIRAATEADQATIRAIIRAAQLNPMSLDWPRFLVAEDGGEIVGIGQVKPHGDGSRELASIAVIPSHQRGGVGKQIIRALLAREAGPLYLMCMAHNETYYQQFGFRQVAPDEMPAVLRRYYRIGRVVGTIISRFTQQTEQAIVMHRPVPAPEARSSEP